MTFNEYAKLMAGAEPAEIDAILYSTIYDDEVTSAQFDHLKTLSEMLVEKRQPTTFLEKFMLEHPGIIRVDENGDYIASSFPTEVEINGEKKPFCPDEYGLGYCSGHIKCMDNGKPVFFCAECWGRALPDGN